MNVDFSKFKCDNCGACCRSLIVEASFDDAAREPRLYSIANSSLDRAKFRRGEHCILLYDKVTRACPFLGPEDNLCGIYATRPLECVSVEPGDAKCQQARFTRGLPLLADQDGNPPSRELLEESCEEYDLDISDVLGDNNG